MGASRRPGERGVRLQAGNEGAINLGIAKPSAIYDEDFLLWTEEQAAALRPAKGSDLTLDWENLAEEIESLGKSDRRELRSQITRILRHPEA